MGNFGNLSSSVKSTDARSLKDQLGRERYSYRKRSHNNNNRDYDTHVRREHYAYTIYRYGRGGVLWKNRNA